MTNEQIEQILCKWQCPCETVTCEHTEVIEAISSRLGAAVSASPQPSVKRQTAREWIKQTGEFDTELYSSVGKEMYDEILAAMSEFGEYVEFFAAAPAQEPDRKMLEAIAEDGLLVTWDKDFKFNFSQVVRLMAEFVIEHPWADAAQEQPVENSSRPKFNSFANSQFCDGCGEKKFAHKGRALYCPELNERSHPGIEVAEPSPEPSQQKGKP